MCKKHLVYQKLKQTLKNTQSPSCQSDDIITSHVASGKLHWTLMGVKKDRRPLHTIMKIV